MVVLNGSLAKFPSSLFDFSASHDGRFGWFLLTWHPENDPVLEEIQTQIKLDIRNSNLGQASQLEIESALKNFFAEYHWKLHAVFRKTNLREKGISLLFAVLFDQELYFLEFGRMLSGIVEKDNIRSADRSWANFHVKTLQEMNLLGLSEADIPIKPKHIHLDAGQKFIALPSSCADLISKEKINSSMFETLIRSITESNDTCYFLLESKAKQPIKRKRRFRKYQISALIVSLLVIVAVLYMLFGNRWLETMERKTKLLVSSKSRLTVERIPDYLNIQSQTIRKQWQKLEQYTNQPARQIDLTKNWTTDLNFLVTATPAFDLHNIYISSEDKLLAFDKHSKKLLWNKTLPANIKAIKIMRGSLVLFLDNDQIYCLKDGNTVSWSKNVSDPFAGKSSLSPFELDSNEDPRLNSSILIVPTERGLYIFDVNSGNLLTKLNFDKHLQFLSSYDAFDNCFYAVAADNIICVSLNIQN